MGAADERPAAKRLLRERASRRHGGGLARQCGVYFGTTGGQVYCSPDGGDSWNAIVRDLPGVLSVEVQTLRMIRVELPFHLRNLARVDGEVQLDVPAPVTMPAVLDALETRYPVFARNDSRSRHTKAPSVRPVLRLQGGSVAGTTGHAVARGRRQRQEPFLIVGAMAGG